MHLKPEVAELLIRGAREPCPVGSKDMTKQDQTYSKDMMILLRKQSHYCSSCYHMKSSHEGTRCSFYFYFSEHIVDPLQTCFHTYLNWSFQVFTSSLCNLHFLHTVGFRLFMMSQNPSQLRLSSDTHFTPSADDWVNNLWSYVDIIVK